jgi:hypothetical protein
MATARPLRDPNPLFIIDINLETNQVKCSGYPFQGKMMLDDNLETECTILMGGRTFSRTIKNGAIDFLCYLSDCSKTSKIDLLLEVAIEMLDQIRELGNE